jgi:hypothetical protein
MTGKPLAFTGKIAYICPHCGREQEFVSMWWEAWKDVRLSSLLQDLLRRHNTEVRTFRCHFCNKPLEPENIREGFFMWLERLKERDPKRYAEILSGLL